jgi:hypothetical protein
MSDPRNSFISRVLTLRSRILRENQRAVLNRGFGISESSYVHLHGCYNKLVYSFLNFHDLAFSPTCLGSTREPSHGILFLDCFETIGSLMSPRFSLNIFRRRSIYLACEIVMIYREGEGKLQRTLDLEAAKNTFLRGSQPSKTKN